MFIADEYLVDEGIRPYEGRRGKGLSIKQVWISNKSGGAGIPWLTPLSLARSQSTLLQGDMARNGEGYLMY